MYKTIFSYLSASALRLAKNRNIDFLIELNSKVTVP
jgi:hypothetical protein